jgi:hypothetical protein
VLYPPTVVHHPKMQCDFGALVARAARLCFANRDTRFDSSPMAVAVFVCAL